MANPIFTNKRKATEEEQLEAAEKLPEPRKLQSFNLDQAQEELSPQDRINLQKEKLKEAGDIISEPAEYDELDTSGYLPNQQMAGQGAWKAIRAALALQPREEEMPIVGKDPVTGKPMRIDPTGVMGIIKDPKIIDEIVKSLPSNVNKKQLLDKLEFKISDPSGDQFYAYDNLLNSAIKKNIENFHKPANSDYFQAHMLDDYYGGISDLNTQNKINVFINSPHLVSPNSLGTAYPRPKNKINVDVPAVIAIKKRYDPTTLMHEAQHFEDMIVNPFEKGKNRQTNYNYETFAKKMNKINPNLNIKSHDIIPGISPDNILIQHDINPYDFHNLEHFTTPEYKTNYELEKALELIRGEPRILDRKGIQNNFDLLQALVNESEKQHFTPKKIKDFLNSRGFQSIDQLLKKKP